MKNLYFWGYMTLLLSNLCVEKDRGIRMSVIYNKLFKLMIDKGIKRIDLLHLTGISPNTLSKFSKNEYVSMDVLVKVCHVLECDIGDIIEVLPESRNNKLKGKNAK